MCSRDSIWSTKPEIITIWPFTEKLCQLLICVIWTWIKPLMQITICWPSMWMGILIIHSWEMIVMILSRLKIFPVLNIFQSFNPIFHVFFLLSVRKMSFIHGVLTTKLGVGFNHISVYQIYLIKNDCLCKDLPTHPCFQMLVWIFMFY